MNSGISSGVVVAFFESEGSTAGGGGGEEVDGWVCRSSRATADEERNRRDVPLRAGEVLADCRTHRRHAPNCRTDGAMAE